MISWAELNFKNRKDENYSQMLTGVRLSFCTLRFCNIIDANMFHCSRPKVDTKFERCFLFLNFPQQSRCTSIFQNTSEERWAILAQNVVVVVVCHSYYFGTILFSVQNFGTNLTVSLMYLDHPYLFYTGCLADVGDIILSGVRSVHSKTTSLDGWS